MRPAIFHSRREIAAALSTRTGGVSPMPLGMNTSYSVGDEKENVEKNRELLVGGHGIGLAELASPQQVHSSTVRRVTEPGVYPECDALITDTPRVFLTVSHADCVPILLYSPAARAVAGIHAGWKGTASEIALVALRAMEEEFGSSPGDTLAFLGPAAGVCCYQVGEDVASRFDKRFVRGAKGTLYVDLKRSNLDQLCGAGVSVQKIEVSPYCTICRPDLFHSYRRDRDKSGRMMAVIGLKSRLS
ncbi:MAG: peptidoglycan editing factor PgeF [Bacteroidota bacterium]